MTPLMTPQIIIVMGVTGAGKTTAGTALAASLGWKFLDADDLHSAENRLRLSRAIPLTDADRAPWLAAIRNEIDKAIAKKEGLVIACSALRKTYRTDLAAEAKQHGTVCFVYLQVPIKRLQQRLAERTGHFANPKLLASQLDALEEPKNESNVLMVNGDVPIDRLVKHIRTSLQL